MKIQGVIVLFVILCCLHKLSAANIDEDGYITFEDSLEAWSCSSEEGATKEDYLQKVTDVLDVMEVVILTHSSWDLVRHRTTEGSEDVLGSAGCLPSVGMKTREDCYACILEARSHLQRRCKNSVRGSVFLTSCTLMYARAERMSEQRDSEEDMTDGARRLPVGSASWR